MFDRSPLRLIATTDNLRDGVDGLVERGLGACRGGATMVHLRLPDEPPRMLVAAARALVKSLSVPIVVHSRVDVALAAGAAGVHLGVRDILPGDVRRVAADLIIGLSVGTEADAGRCATKDRADYVTIGPVFPATEQHAADALGLDEFTRLSRIVSLPVVAIGGITARTAPDAIGAGASGVALIGGIFGATDPEAAARSLRAAIET